MLRRVRTPLTIAAAAAAGLVLVWLLAYQVVPTRDLDGSVYATAEGWHRQAAGLVGHLVVLPIVGPVYVLLAAAAVALAARNRGAATAIVAGGVIAGANVITQVLKEATATDRPWSMTDRGFFVNLESWPSGHATASTALVIAFALGAATPLVRARIVRWGGLWALAVAVSVVWMGWHLPSDVLGGWCVVTAVTAVGVAGLRARAALPARRRERAVPSTQSA